MYREQMDVGARNEASSGIQANVTRHCKHSLALLAVHALNAILFYATFDSYWLRAPLAILGLSIGILWACVNSCPHRFHYPESCEIAFGLGLSAQWLTAVFLATANFMLGICLASAWGVCIAKYVIGTCLSSAESFASFLITSTLFAGSIRIYPKAFSAECSLLLECDHVLRTAGLRSKSKGKVYEITCSNCGEFYYTPEPLFTRGLCKQCYAHDRFEADCWVGAAAFSMLIWSVGLRQLAFHLVHDQWLKWVLWAGLFYLSGLLWWPSVQGRWHVLFYWPRLLRSSNRLPKSVPAPKLIADSDGIKDL
jgi:hypothetical protein